MNQLEEYTSVEQPIELEFNINKVIEEIKTSVYDKIDDVVKEIKERTDIKYNARLQSLENALYSILTEVSDTTFKIDYSRYNKVSKRQLNSFISTTDKTINKLIDAEKLLHCEEKDYVPNQLHNLTVIENQIYVNLL